jgi:hypothetical protein
VDDVYGGGEAIEVFFGFAQGWDFATIPGPQKRGTGGTHNLDGVGNVTGLGPHVQDFATIPGPQGRGTGGTLIRVRFA